MPNIPATSQFAAVAWLRWRLFANAFRRKGGTGELIARIITYPIALAFLLLVIAGAAAGSYYTVASGHLGALPVLFWIIFGLQVIVSVNLAPPGLSFDPESLIRFPVSFTRYLTIRLFLGLLSASTIVGTAALLAAATGITVARPDLALTAFSAALLLALANLLLIRVIFAWLDRWLSTRRAREAVTALIILGSLGFQYLNITFNPGFRAGNTNATARVAAVRHAYAFAEPVLVRLPPGLAANAILSRAFGHPGLAAAQLTGVFLFAAFALAIFAWRMAREYRGENLSEAGNSPTPAARSTAPAPAAHAPAQTTPAQSAHSAPALLSPVITACLTKEVLYVRRNLAQFYAVLFPLAMVFIIASRFRNLADRGLMLPAAVAYGFLSIAALSYNAFGHDATAIQGYLLAPIRMRTVMLSKNILNFTIAALQFVLIFIMVSALYTRPSLLLTAATLCWLLLALFVNTAVGNIRSLTAPKKMDPTKLNRRQASQLSALLSLGVVALLIGLGVGLHFLAAHLALPWLPIPVLAALAAAAYALYLAGLNRVDTLALSHRENLLEELCKAT